MTDHRIPRIPPLAVDDRSDEQRELLGSVGGDHALRVFATIVRHPGLFRRWLPFGAKLLQGGKLDAREREILILRTAWRCRAEYEWGQHVAIAREAGLADPEILAVARPADEGDLSAADRLLVQAADELLDDHRLSDSTYQALADVYDEQQLLEVLMLPGHYAMLAGVLNSLEVQPEEGAPVLGEG